MEERNITQVRIYKLILNPMAGCAEGCELVAASGDYHRLTAWYREQFAPEAYRDDSGWWRTFREDSPLFWYNPCGSLELNADSLFGQGVFDEWANEDTWLRFAASGRCHIVD